MGNQMKKLAVTIGAMLSAAAGAQSVELDMMHSWDTDRTTVDVVKITGWKHRPDTVSAQVMDWYSVDDIETNLSTQGILRLKNNNTNVAAVAGMSRRAMSSTSFRVQVKSNNWQQVEAITVIFGSDGFSAENTLTLDIRAAISESAPNDEWIDVEIPFANAVVDGGPDTQAMNFVMIRANGSTGSYVDIGGIYGVDSAGVEEPYFSASFDPARNQVENSADVGYTVNFGAAATRYWVEDRDGRSGNANDIRVLGSFSTADYTISGSLGDLRGEGQNTVVGGLRGVYTALPSTELSLEYNKALVDSIDGIAAGITAETTTAAVDWNQPQYGAYFGLSNISYSDSNRRSLYSGRAYVTVLPEYGVNAYVKAKYHTDTDPYTGTYFSPEEYGRFAIGVSVRHAVTQTTTVSAHVDSGPQWTDGDRENGWTARLQIEEQLAKNWRVKAAIGADETEPGYRYNYMFGQLTYLF